MNWNLQEKGRTKAAVIAALAKHPSSNSRTVSVEGVSVEVPPALPVTTRSALESLIESQPEVAEGQVMNLSTWGDERTLNVNLALEDAPTE